MGNMRSELKTGTTTRCLWLTWVDPRLEHDGQRIYSSKLIHALARQGVDLHVLCFSEDTEFSARRSTGDVSWHLVQREQRPAWKSVLSRWPHVAYRSATLAMRQRLGALIGAGMWDCIVIDGFSLGWSLPTIRQLYRSESARPRIVHISHNHEESLRWTMARNCPGNPVFKSLLLLDWWKVRQLERRLVAESDIVTAITEEDAFRYRSKNRSKSVVALPPGYDGRRIASRHITEGTPRQAILLGSFEWMAKRMNLIEFLTVADPLVGRSGASLSVVGRCHPDFLTELRRRFPYTNLVGEVESVEPYLNGSRIAVVPERTGGGFKLKVLDYVFHRLPVAALEGSVAGTPLRAGESILTFHDHRALATGMLAAIDDLERLNRLQERAYAQCFDAFDWWSRGALLYSKMAA